MRDLCADRADLGEQAQRLGQALSQHREAVAAGRS